ncbi:MAG: TonB family protein [Bacteroidales bacterium]|nr:TonB family protein [Bacteroidales bacterium]
MEKRQNDMLFTSSGCLTERGLSLFTHGLLPDEDAASVKAHLGSCELCSAAAEGMLLADPAAFSEDVTILNSFFTDQIFKEEDFQETVLTDQNRFEGPRYPLMKQEEIRRFADRLKIKAEKDNNSLPEDEPLPVKSATSKTIFQRHKFRLLAAVILLLTGIGSILFYLQLKEGTVNNHATAFIEKPDTISQELAPIGQVADKKVLPENKVQPGSAFSLEKDSGKVITVNTDNETTALGYAGHQVAGLIDKSSYTNQDGKGIAPALGMPRGAIPGAPKVPVGKKAPELVVENEIDILVVSSDSEESSSAPVEFDEKVYRETNMKSAMAEEEKVEAEIFTVVEESPHYPGGDEMRIKFLQENIKYPQAAREALISGLVYITFVIEIDGSITDIRVLKGIGGGCNEEAVRVIGLMPKWIPGKQRGKPVRVQFSMPVQFKLAG